MTQSVHALMTMGLASPRVLGLLKAYMDENVPIISLRNEVGNCRCNAALTNNEWSSRNILQHGSGRVPYPLNFL
ncbi:hypothetical protein P692DRAFT_20830230 [Suillus brevipes Sb2]|nr:hypothetical protein P692DRAFT_20830230 [Suillus brevipes Sb2]